MLPGGGGSGFLEQSADSDSIIKNCISYNNKLEFDHGGGIGTFTEDYNDSFGNSGGNGNMWGPAAHDIAANPQFVSQSTNDYHLALASPARNAGVAIAGVNDPPRVQPPDIGYYDRGLTAPTDPGPPPDSRTFTVLFEDRSFVVNL